jgi:hypothetical protein
MRRQCMIKHYFASCSPIRLYRKVSVLHVNRTFVRFTHDAYNGFRTLNGQKILVQSSPSFNVVSCTFRMISCSLFILIFVPRVSGTKACEKLTTMIEDKRLQNNIKKLSPLHQTSNVEAFHSLILKFCPKTTTYSYMGMHCR